MPPLAAVAESVLAPAIGSLVGPLVSQLAGPLQGILGGVAGEFGKLLEPFEKAFLGPLAQLGQALMPPVGQFPHCPPPFPKPPFADDPLAPFKVPGGSNAFSPDAIAGAGKVIDDMQAHAMSVLQDPCATQAQIAAAQNELQKANLMFSALSDILKQKNQEAEKAIQNAVN
jgi:hypothetical protein